MVQDIPDEDDDEPEVPGRGMVEVSLDPAGIVVLRHLLNGQTFGFIRGDLDEVIGTLSIFRMALEANETGGEPEENGRA